MYFRVSSLLPVAASFLVTITLGCSAPKPTQSSMQSVEEKSVHRAAASPARAPIAAARKSQRELTPDGTAPVKAAAGARERARTGHILDLENPKPIRKGHAAVRSSAATRPPTLPGPASSGAIKVLTTEADDVFPRFIAELNRALSRDQLRVFSSTFRRSNLQALHDVGNFSVADMAIVQSDAITALGEDDPARGPLRYIGRLYDKEVHLIASREIADVRQLHGRKVNIDKPVTGTHLTARRIFEKLGIVPLFTTDDQANSFEKLRSGEIAAAIYVMPRPDRKLADFQADGRFHLVGIPYGPELADYSPTQVKARDYPNLIQGEPVETVSVATVLAVPNWPEGSERYKRAVRFVDAYFSRYTEIRDIGGHPKWEEANPSGTAAGWERFRPAQDWLQRRGPPLHWLRRQGPPWATGAMLR